MAARRRLGQRNSKTRAAILEAAEKILLDEGATALTSRRIAEKAGVKSQLIHYYFRTMEDLIVTLMQRAGDEVLTTVAGVTASDNPLQGLWKVALESTSSAMVGALLVLAADYERVRAEAIRYAEQGRVMQTEAIARHLKLRGLAPPIPPVAIAFLISAAARQAVQERAAGLSLGHSETVTAIESWLLQFTVKPLSAKRVSKRARVSKT
jgi:TetR/AcrR family transcriptional regulator